MSAETKYDLNEYQSVTIDANGNGTLIFGPQQQTERWEIRKWTTHSNVTGGDLTIYRNVPNPGNQEDYTLRVEDDSSSDMRVELMAGERLLFVYAKCTPDNVMSAGVMGLRYVKGRRAY